MSSIVSYTLKDKWLAFHSENPRIRIRDAARQLDTTEAEILAAFAGSSVIRLGGFGGQARQKRTREAGSRRSEGGWGDFFLIAKTFFPDSITRLPKRLSYLQVTPI